MKKTICVAISLLLTLIAISSLAESEAYTLEPTLANAIGYTAEKWFQSEENRALLTVILALEYSSYDKSFDLNCLYSDTSYVAYAEKYPAVMVCMFDDDKSHSIMYMPRLKTAMIPEPVDGGSETVIEMAFEMSGFEYEKNSKSALSDAVDYVSGALEVIKKNY